MIKSLQSGEDVNVYETKNKKEVVLLLSVRSVKAF
jgi:hypothetical protein